MTRPRPADRDGSFSLEYRQGFAVLSVRPPSGRGRPVYVEEVIARMNLLGVPHVSRQVLGRVIAEATGQPVRLVEWPAGEELSATAEVSVAEDAMSARLLMHAPRKGGAMLTVEDLREALEARGVVFGVDEALLRRVVEKRLFERQVVVARGRPAVDGKPRRVRYSFDPVVGKPYLEGEFGRINLRELNFVHEKRRGDVLAELIPAEPPVSGADVMGRLLTAAATAEDEPLVPGRNTELSEDGTVVMATIDGNAFVEGGVVHVEPVIAVENVNYETGNIRFEGTVVVSGTIADGFTVEAGGTLDVGQRVGRVFLKAGRRLVLKGGANSNHEGSIECAGDIFARYLENARVTCGGDLVVEEAVMHSQISVRGNLVLGGRRAELFGGRTVVGGSLWCRQLGSVAEVPTPLYLGIDPALLELVSRTRREVEEGERALEELAKKIRHLESHRPEDAETAAKVDQALSQLQAQTQTLAHEVREKIRLSHEHRKNLLAPPQRMVVTEGTMHYGVTVSFGNAELTVPPKGLQATVLRVAGGRIVESGFNPADPPTLAPAGEGTQDEGVHTEELTAPDTDAEGPEGHAAARTERRAEGPSTPEDR